MNTGIDIAIGILCVVAVAFTTVAILFGVGAI